MSLLEAIKKVSEKLDLEHQNSKYSILDCFLDMVIVAGPDGIIKFANNSSILLGYKPKELIGKKIETLIYDNHVADSHDSYLTKYLLNKNNSPVCIERETLAKDKNGKPLKIYLYVGEFQDPGRTFIAILHKVD